MSLSFRNMTAIGLILFAKVLSIIGVVLGFAQQFRTISITMFIVAGLCILGSVVLAVIQMRKLHADESDQKRSELAKKIATQFNIDPKVADQIAYIKA